MSDLFSKLGALAQQAGLSVPGAASGAAPGGQQNQGGAGGMLGALKDSIPGGVGGLLGAGALGGILGTLMSGKTAKKVGEGLLVAGGTAAAAALAWKFYEKWQQNSAASGGQTAPAPQAGSGGWPNPAQPASAPYAQPALSAATDPTAMLVLTAMVFAARADGFVDDSEQANVHVMMEKLFPGTDVARQMDGLMRCPVDPHALARQVVSAEQGRDVYRLSCMVIVRDQAMERAYLDALAQALGISRNDQQMLEQEVDAMKGE